MTPSTSPASGATVWCHAAGTAAVESDQRAVVLDLEHLDHAPYVFDGPAAQVWACVDGYRTESEIVHDLAEAFGVSTRIVADDVRGFVDQLAQLGLIVAAGR